MYQQYGEHEANVILGGGINSKIFFSGCDEATCDKVSRLLGNITSHTNKGKIIKPLMNPQEIRMMKDNEAVYLFSNKKPILLKIRPYFESFIYKIYSAKDPFVKLSKTLPNVSYIKLN